MQISGASSSPYLQQLQQSLFQKADTNTDGSLTLDEFTATGSEKSAGSASTTDKAKAEKLFKSIDANGDDKVSGDELGSFFTKLSSSTQSSLLQIQQQGGADHASDFLSRADTDEDGGLNLDEFTAAGPKGASADKSKEIFGEIDADGDGTVTKDELTAFDQSRDAGKSGEARHMPPPPPPSDSSDSDDGSGTSLADILAGLSSSSSSASSSSDSSTATSLADVLSSVSSTDSTATNSKNDFAKQMMTYLQQMLSGYADQTKNSTSTSTVSIAA